MLVFTTPATSSALSPSIFKSLFSYPVLTLGIKGSFCTLWFEAVNGCLAPHLLQKGAFLFISSPQFTHFLVFLLSLALAVPFCSFSSLLGTKYAPNGVLFSLSLFFGSSCLVAVFLYSKPSLCLSSFMQWPILL